MPFFLPTRLVGFEYLRGDGFELDSEYENEAKPFLDDLDFAFFFVNFGCSKSEYNELTMREKAFIMKAYENKIVSETAFMYKAMYTATFNVNRGKRKRALKLWKKGAVQKVNMEVVQDNIKIAEEVYQKEGMSWLEKVYRANGMEYKGKR